MESAYILGGVYIVLGILMLLYGIMFMRLAISAYGAMVGLWIGSAIASGLNFSGFGEFLIITGAAIACALLAFSFYKLLVSLSISFFVFSLTYAVIIALGGSALPALIFTGLAGVATFFIIRKFKLINSLFIIVISAQGASAILAGALMLTTHENIEHHLIHGQTNLLFSVGWVWTVIWIALTIFGIASQHNRFRTQAK